MIQVHFQYDHRYGGYAIYAYEFDGKLRWPIKLSIEYSAVKSVPLSHEMAPSALLTGPMDQEFLKAMVQGMSEAGLMPKTTATESELKATKYHLEDMRKLAMEEK